MKAVVFLGPSVPVDQVRGASDFAFRPPAAQGDIFRAVGAGAGAIGLIDGLFLDVPAVWHREILWALSRGVHVFGAASMGALRAAELDVFGMRGIGRIYRAFATGAWPGWDGAFEDDDEVAVTHAPANAGFAPLSDAMVDIRASLDAAVAAGALAATRARALAADAKRRAYPQRSLAALAGREPALAPFCTSIKRQDALEMLDAMTAFLSQRPAPHEPNFRFERAGVWERFMAAESFTDRRRKALDRLREEHGLWLRRDLDGWMAKQGMDEGGLARLLDAMGEP